MDTCMFSENMYAALIFIDIFMMFYTSAQMFEFSSLWKQWILQFLDFIQ